MCNALEAVPACTYVGEESQHLTLSKAVWWWIPSSAECDQDTNRFVQSSSLAEFGRGAAAGWKIKKIKN